MAEYRYHPEIEGLKVNEDGTEVFLHDKPVELKKKRRPSGYIYRYFFYKKYQIGLAKIVLECWKGLADNKSLTAIHINDVNNFHYSNLKWGKKAGNNRFPQKLTEDQKTEILEKLAQGQQGAVIAREYNVNKNAIYQLKNKT